jgi:tetratricopeptide (TPR) repeat protein
MPPAAASPARPPCRWGRSGAASPWGLAPLTWAALALLLAACSTAPPPPPPQQLWADTQFEPPQPPLEDARQALVASPAMLAWLAAQPALRSRAPHRDRALMKLLDQAGALRLDYDARRTRTATEAFEARQGNCLSLVLMTAALADALGLDLQFQQVEVDDNWRRQGDMFVSALHVNLVLTPAAISATRLARGWQESLVVDFLPAQDLQRRRVRRIGEATVLAMYLNNRAAEHLLQARFDAAYAAVRQALKFDPQLALAYNTLGVIYTRRGLAQQAVLAFDHAQALAPDNLNVLANRATAWRRAGDLRRAEALDRELLQREPDPPYAYFDRGMAAYRAGRLPEARRWLEREVQRVPDEAEFRYWLAVVALKLGDEAGAQAQLSQAVVHSDNRDERALYAAKLAWLRGPH